jgi:hypothetical protein
MSVGAVAPGRGSDARAAARAAPGRGSDPGVAARAAPGRGSGPGVAARAAPALVAGALALAYVLAAPPSSDLAAVMARVRLYRIAGFTLWDNWWYGGHYTLSYSVLLAPLAAAISAQLTGALAAVAAGALFEPLARRAFGARAWLGACWFAAGGAAQLYCGRIAFVLGLAFGVAMALALQRRHRVTALSCAVLCALSSPVAAAFAALAGGCFALSGHTTSRSLLSWSRKRLNVGAGVVLAALAPVLALALAFPQSGTEPFALSALAPIPPLAALLAWLTPRRQPALRLGALLYATACLVTYLIPTALGGNVVRLGALAVGPLFALILYPRRWRWLALAAPLLLYLQLQAPVRDLLASTSSPTASAGYWRPLLAFLRGQGDRPFRVEIAFTALHWESYYVAPQAPLARGWERQLDTGEDRLFYERGGLSATSYETWLHALAVRYVVLPAAALDRSAEREAELIRRGLPYLRLVWHTGAFEVYAVRNATTLAQGAATATALGADSVTLRAARAGSVLVRVRYSPYWAITDGAGCVVPAGGFTRLTLWRGGRVKLGISFALKRIGARSPRCTRSIAASRTAGRRTS